MKGKNIDFLTKCTTLEIGGNEVRKAEILLGSATTQKGNN